MRFLALALAAVLLALPARADDSHIANFKASTAAQRIDAATTAATKLSCTAGQCDDLVIFNSGTDIVFFKFGDSTVSVTAPTVGTNQACLFVPGGAMVVVKIPPSATHIGTLANSGTQTIFIAPGYGS